mgnify:CR=1 FL=1
MDNKHPEVALVSGFWGQNIGNAFFNIGGKWILEEVFQDRKVEFIQDQPGYRTFNNQKKGNPKNDVGLLKYLDVEYIVLQGPMLTVTFRSLWEETFSELTKRGTKIILLSAGLFRYTKEEIKEARKFLKEFPPYIISTRDYDTYEAIKDCCDRTYNGIDSAFFVPYVYTPFKLNIENYITLNFDRFPEPTITVGQEIPQDDYDNVIEFDSLKWGLKYPSTQMFFSEKGKAEAYIGHLLDRRKLPSRLADYLIIRPEHRFNPHMTHKIYQHRNAIASDEPFTYFTIYANTKLTLSDRVHACVATLAYGNPAMLFTPSPRAKLFERLNLTKIKEMPMTLDMDYLERERRLELEFLKKAVN